MAIATAAGIFIGLFLGEMCSVFAPWASAYIMILKITTIPYLICAVMHGIGRLGSTAAKEILQKGLIFIGIAWTINISMIYLGTFLFPKSSGIPFSTFSSSQPASINFAQLLIPENIFYALSNNVIPAIVVFGILVGIALIHTIGRNTTAVTADPWINRYIFPNGHLPSIAQIGQSIEHLFVMEDWHNLNTNYDATLLAWYKNFENSWDQLKSGYSDQFFKMWKYYLLSCAGAFRARNIQLWQVVLSKSGTPGGYESIR